jgi:hypothetical protein
MVYEVKRAVRIIYLCATVHSCSMLMSGVAAGERISIHSHQPSVYHIYVGTTPVHHNTPTLVTSSVATASVMQQIQTPSGAVTVGWWKWIKDGVKGAQRSTDLHVCLRNSSWWSYISAHKWSLGIKAIGGVYCLLNYRLFSLNAYLAEPGRWFLWKRRVSLIQLIRIPEDELMRELLETMRLKRAQALSESNREDMIQLMIVEIDEELKKMEQYRWYADRLQTCDEFQRQFGVICEGYIPSLGGISWGYMARKVLQVIGIRSCFYLNQRIIDDIPTWMDRLHYLREVLERAIEPVNEPTLPVFLKKCSWYTT